MTPRSEAPMAGRERANTWKHSHGNSQPKPSASMPTSWPRCEWLKRPGSILNGPCSQRPGSSLLASLRLPRSVSEDLLTHDDWLTSPPPPATR